MPDLKSFPTNLDPSWDVSALATSAGPCGYRFIPSTEVLIGPWDLNLADLFGEICCAKGRDVGDCKLIADDERVIADLRIEFLEKPVKNRTIDSFKKFKLFFEIGIGVISIFF